MREIGLEELVTYAKKHNEEAQLELLRRFGYENGKFTGGFLKKYYDLLWNNLIKWNDKDTRKFIRLYMSDAEIRQKLHFRLQGKDTRRAGQKLVTMLSEKLHGLEEEDVIQDFVLLFLERVNRYQKTHKRIDFAGYIYNTYRFSIYHYLRKHVLKEEGCFHPKRVPILLEEEIEGMYGGIEIEDCWFYKESSLRDEEDLGIHWVNGECHELFLTLTPMERLLLKMYYEDGKTDTEIAKDLGFHRNTILKYRHRAVDTLGLLLHDLERNGEWI